ncbi:hypothetical protein BT96DRAFT_945957 [Gymnopus androsaceus JB14]|uniref:Uncharacterized protein n=1 Tax=Gymnopus androsaceus JB14 TaxID=1447944 RepID=A0A6A4GXS5_9AGAR|nr:hypothetical protein BT96DRAFT_945957 [Gymnopus androsaceus JB14]
MLYLLYSCSSVREEKVLDLVKQKLAKLAPCATSIPRIPVLKAREGPILSGPTLWGDPKKRKDPKQVKKKLNKKGEEVLMLPRPATKGVAMIMDNKRMYLHVNFNSLIGSMFPLQTFPLILCTTCIKSRLQCSVPPPELNPGSPVCHLCWKPHASFISVKATALFKDAVLHYMGHLVHGMKRLQNLTTNPWALLQGLIQERFVEKDDTEHLSLLAFLLGWEMHVTLENLEFATLQNCSHAPSSLQSHLDHLELLMDPLELPMVPMLLEKTSSKASKEESDKVPVDKVSNVDALGDKEVDSDEEVDSDKDGLPSKVEEETSIIEILSYYLPSFV